MGALLPDGLVGGNIYEALGALSPDGLVGESPLINYEALGALSPDGLVGESPLINLLGRGPDGFSTNKGRGCSLT